MSHHLDQYSASLTRDKFEGSMLFVEGQLLGDQPALPLMRSAIDRAVDAASRGDEAAYWPAVERHQAALFEMHRRKTQQLFGGVTDAFSAFDFIKDHGWRRFRFSERILHMKLELADGPWLVSILPNYRQENLRRLDEFLGCEERHVAVDAVEMEAFLSSGTKESLHLVLQEKLEPRAGVRHVARSAVTGPGFMKLALRKSNSQLHVSDWTLPLRS